MVRLSSLVLRWLLMDQTEPVDRSELLMIDPLVER